MGEFVCFMGGWRGVTGKGSGGGRGSWESLADDVGRLQFAVAALRRGEGVVWVGELVLVCLFWEMDGELGGSWWLPVELGRFTTCT